MERSFSQSRDDLGKEIDESVLKAPLVDSTSGNVSSSPWKSDAEAPTGIVDLGTTFVLTLVELVLTSLGILALLKLFRASLLDTLLEFIRCKSNIQQGNEGNKD